MKFLMKLVEAFWSVWTTFFPVKAEPIPLPIPLPIPKPEPLPPPVPSPPKLPPLWVSKTSRFFHASNTSSLVTYATSVVDYREATAMGIYRLWLDGKHEDVEKFFVYLKDNRFTAIRVLLNLDSYFWRTYERQNSFKEGKLFCDNLVPFIQCAANYGLYTRLCLFGGVEPFGVQTDWNSRPDVVSSNPVAIALMFDYLDEVVAITRDETSVLYEIANEPGQIGFGEDSRIVVELGEELAYYLAPNRIMNLGAATDEDNLFYLRYPASFFDEHLARREQWDYHASIKRLINHPGLDQAKMPFISGEWMNLGAESGTPSTATAFASAAMLRLKHAIPAFHARCLLWGGVPDPITDACVKAWHNGLDLVPIEVKGNECNGHHTCSPFDSEIFPPTEDATDEWDGPIRIFGRTQYTPAYDYIGLSIREPIGYHLSADSRTPISTIHLESWGDWQSRLVIA